jgi:2-polyprenyl-3-methyl-5-hydroxy-6-metoxy-1,4-benzoquinol methylase
MKEIFTGIYKNNDWKSDESVSGQGSTMDATEGIRRELPKLLNKFHVKSLLDIPCGDCNWINRVDFPEDFEYHGADIVEEVVELARDNMRGRYGWNQNNFTVLDITKDQLPKVDLILVRDLFGHFSEPDLALAIKNVKSSGAKYLLATTFPSSFNTVRIQTGQWHALNLDYYCGLPPVLEIINEGNQMFKDKCLGLWQLR